MVNEEVGRRVHSVIAAFAGAPEPPTSTEIIASVRDLWAADPVGGSVASSARLRCSTAVSSYMQRFRPTGWQLASAEVRVGAAVADLVWRSGDLVVIDEVKTGVASHLDDRIADQLDRLVAGGHARWGGDFAGVRLVPLGSPARSVMIGVDGPVDFVDGMVPR